MSGPTRVANPARTVRCSAGCGTLVWFAGALPVAADDQFLCPRCLNGAGLIAAERRRQIDVEGYTVEHDHAENDLEQLLAAAWCYLGDLTVHGSDFTEAEHMEPPDGWPWEPEFWRPTPQDDIRQLVKAGALIAAEIDRRLKKSAGVHLADRAGSAEDDAASPSAPGGES